MSSQNSDENAQKEEVNNAENLREQPESDAEDDDDDSESDSSSDSEPEPESEKAPLAYTRPDGKTRQLRPEYDGEDENSPEGNVRRFMDVLNSKGLRRAQDEEDKKEKYPEDMFDFPPDPENWREEDLKEFWADAPIAMTKPGWDPDDVDEEEVDIISDEINSGGDPPIQPFYVPYRKPYPAIPDNHFDISNPKEVIEELDRIEEFLNWVSFIFPDGSSYEGTVWDDRAHGKGVYVAEDGLYRYEGEWLQNDMDGHGIVEVDIPVPEPIPGSKHEAKMRAEGSFFSWDFMSPEDRKWLQMDVEDSLLLADGEHEIPFYENEEWVRQFGQKPEKGRYRYAGQWKQGRMHGCGVYQVNERTIWGRFYFGDLLEDSTGCDINICSMHAGIAEVAAAKARMFVNKPDGMVREYYGPFGDPQHAYFYEEDDVWMAPGFINQFYDVPDYWKTYVQEVDKEREMWLNSFYKAPLRLPMPAELEHWWSTYEKPEFVLVNSDPVPDPEDPSKLIYPEDPLILHTPTGRFIDYVEDEEHGVRLFWQPEGLNDDEEIDLNKVDFLPLGFDDFYGKDVGVPDTMWMRFVKYVNNACQSFHDRLEKLSKENKRAGEARMEDLTRRRELMEEESAAEKREIAALDKQLKLIQEEAEKKLEKEEDVPVPEPTKQEEEVEEDEDDEEENSASSFGFTDDPKQNNSGKSPFAAASLVLATFNLPSSVFPKKLQLSPKPTKTPVAMSSCLSGCSRFDRVTFPRAACKASNMNLRCQKQARILEAKPRPRNRCKRMTDTVEEHVPITLESLGILSLHATLTELPNL